jgi:hypothetical protein
MGLQQGFGRLTITRLIIQKTERGRHDLSKWDKTMLSHATGINHFQQTRNYFLSLLIC